ncbi:hypothetical protein GN956_G4047 [Arapaima gigas]
MRTDTVRWAAAPAGGCFGQDGTAGHQLFSLQHTGMQPKRHNCFYGPLMNQHHFEDTPWYRRHQDPIDDQWYLVTSTPPSGRLSSGPAP